MAPLPEPKSRTLAALDEAVVATTPRDFDHVVRGSAIGHPCERHLWFRFRWAHPPEKHDGRKLRLFQTGNEEEARLIAYLRLAGVTVEAVDPATGQQWEVVALDGHFAGHLDGIASGILEAPKTLHLLECKTHNAKSFGQLLKAGAAASKPEHVAQMQVYMHLRGLTRAFYLAKNKDTDELYAERVEYDAEHALRLMAKAGRIVAAHSAPARISDDPNFFQCRAFGCSSYGVCHGGQFALSTCRTCLHASPGPAGSWHCARWGRPLELDEQRKGCPAHLFLPDLVPGEQVDADPGREVVTYRLADGRMWVDGEGRAA